MPSAPYRADLAEGPDDARVEYAQTVDNIRLRLCLWPSSTAKATILLFPGRTEYIEKYGRVARHLTASGYSVATLDWRGQGLSDRLSDDPLLGHVLRFRDYQTDVATLLEFTARHGTPAPHFLLAHSMGGCIGLRALTQGLPVERAVFSAPMWGIKMKSSQRPAAAILPALARLTGQGHRYTPGSRPVDYDPTTGFDDNLLTGDLDHFAYLCRHQQQDPRFALGGPSLVWFHEALRECRALVRLPRPTTPARIYVGTREDIVTPEAITRIHANWPQADLAKIDGARHELMMETPDIRDRFFKETLAFFDAAAA